MNVIAILHKSAGNETVGTMWHETKVFTEQNTIEDVLRWMIERDECRTEAILTIESDQKSQAFDRYYSFKPSR